MRSLLACLACVLALGACRVPLRDKTPPSAWAAARVSLLEPGSPVLGGGAAPGNARGPGDFVARGSARNFYAGPAGRLWYYTNNYYWVSDTAPREDLWIKTEVFEQFVELRRWPDGKSVKGPEPKVTVEYWEVAPSGRSVRLDNHKDYCSLSDSYTAGAIEVKVTLTLGHLSVKDKRSRWGPPDEAYVLESRNYSTGGGIGKDHARFEPLRSEAVTVWGYRVPWDTHPQRLTRSNWKKLQLPTWKLEEHRAPPPSSDPAPVVTPRPIEPKGS